MPDINTENRSVNSPDLNTERNSPEFFRDMFLAKTAAEDKPAENDSARCATPGKDILPPDFPYADIINLPRPEPKKHKRMTRQDRAAQFAPFAALTGLDEIMEEKEQEALDFNK